MKIRSLSALLAVAALVGVGLVACSSTTDNTAGGAAASGNCPAVGSKLCTADDAITQADIDGCEKSKAEAKCGSKYVDVLKCIGSNPSCGADNKSDDKKQQTACATQITAYSTCLQGAPVDAGGD